MTASARSVQSTEWRGQKATRLTNGVIELIAETEGGHLAELRFLDTQRASSQNVLWESPWSSLKLSEMSAQDLVETAGITGHGLCLDHFGQPSEEEAAIGHALHGEAGIQQWNITWPNGQSDAEARWRCRLPIAQLGFARDIRLGERESVAYVREQVANERAQEYAFDWVQHATFGPPFLASSETTFAASGKRGITARSAYEGCSRVSANQEFLWPMAPSDAKDGGTTDLRQPLTEEGKGLLAAIELDPARKVEYILAINRKLRLGVGYCFRREDFPWMVVWEENGARRQSPWNGKGQARGMEFGTTPYVQGRSEAQRVGPLFNTQTLCILPAGGEKKARYLIFLFRLTEGLQVVHDVQARGDAILLLDERGNPALSIPAQGCEEFLSSRP